jgi:hypothetical protein
MNQVRQVRTEFASLKRRGTIDQGKKKKVDETRQRTEKKKWSEEKHGVGYVYQVAGAGGGDGGEQGHHQDHEDGKAPHGGR